MKLLIDEQRSPEMRMWFNDHSPCWSSELLRTETLRAAARRGFDRAVADRALRAVRLVLPTATTFRIAGELTPATVRSLDSLHLAAAIELGSDLDGLVTYDERVKAGARAASLTVLSP